jgi:hypothetical protein
VLRTNLDRGISRHESNKSLPTSPTMMLSRLARLLFAASTWNWILLVSSQPYRNNAPILMDSMQLNPGDPVGRLHGSKYSDPSYLQRLGYSARTSSMEQSPALCVNYAQADRVNSEEGVFHSNRNSSSWVQAYCDNLRRYIQDTKHGGRGMELYFFTDMIVFPKYLIGLYPEVVQPDSTTIVWNNYTEYLLTVMIEEWFQRFPETDGIVIRTGETYTFDTPYHAGSSPVAGIHNATARVEIWVQYLQWLRQVVCLQHGRQVIFRTWYSIVDVTTYQAVTERVVPHPRLYFSVKHTAADFFRQMSFNPLVNIGAHAQVLEVQIQREYEGKGAYPLYLFEHIVLGDQSSGDNRSLSDLFPHGRQNETSSRIMGLWTWSRGGGWWGPYIHGAEFWIDLNLGLLLAWWQQEDCNTNADTVEELFQSVCTNILLQGSGATGSLNGVIMPSLEHVRDACSSLRGILLIADRALLYGRYCMEAKAPYGNCWMWTRDDRIGGLNEIQAHIDYLRGNDTRIKQSLWYKNQSVMLWDQALQLYVTNVAPTVMNIDVRLNRQIRSSFLYAQSYFCILESSWRALIYGELFYGIDSVLHLRSAIADYDSCWNGFRAHALAIPEFPSLYKGIYWNFPFEQEHEGMDATIDRLRVLLSDNVSGKLLVSEDR